MIKPIITLAALAFASIPLAGCNNPLANSPTAIATAEDICAAVAVEQSSGLKLNAAQTTAVNGLINSCALTSQGANLSSGALMVTFFSEAVALQNSGLLSNLKLTALAPEQKQKLDRIELDWNKAKAAGIVH